ncbi:hypothetical protein CWE15_02575 [Aliidiomarina taiwanensis]|uniref:Uncharacterized protein n=1 Tax=Aliidiomarina taiwanensis TaxID=946228 RepID=A0A432X9K7_9GAMM|nr:hypothetical protein [Aliidiomarina taiwanensis]RUO44078.1 hypothetical protein CWE15_02575 [Aliidiomarina taiwanensis]
MNPFSMVVIIVVASLVAGIVGKIVQLKYENKSGTDNETVSSLKNDVERLKERVKTLEALVTDQSYRVKSEIDKL